MPYWIQDTPDRWVWDLDDRHLLLKLGGRLVEHHIGVVHVYDSPELLDSGNPLGDAVWVLTETRTDLTDTDTAGLWSAMAEEKYTKPKLP